MDVSMVQKKTCFYPCPLPSHGFWGVFKHERGGGGGYCMLLLWGVSLSTLWQVHAYGIANLASTSAVGFPWLRVKQSSTASLMLMECFKFCWGLIHLYYIMIFGQNHFRKRFSTHLEHFSGCLSRPGGTPKYQPLRWLSANHFWCENIHRYCGSENTWLVLA